MHKIVVVGAGSDIAQALLMRIRSGPWLEAARVKAFTSAELDVTNQSQMTRITMQRPDILIVFAGVITPEPVTGSSVSAWHRQINVNLLGSYNCVQAALSVNPKCKIILIGSSAARKARATWSAYCASKAGVSMFVECMIQEGVDAWCLNIGRTASKMRRGLFPNEDQGALMQPDVVANEIVQIMLNRRVDRISWLARGRSQ